MRISTSFILPYRYLTITLNPNLTVTVSLTLTPIAITHRMRYA